MLSESQKIKKILVPLDGSKNSLRGLQTGINLAKEHEATLTVIYAIHLPHKKENKQKAREEETLPEFILFAKKLAANNGVPFYSRILTGDPGYSIVEYSNIHKIDLIVIGARGLSTLKKIFLGSVSSYVMQKSKVAVMLIK